MEISTLLRCCCSCLPTLLAESTLPESFSSRLALRVCELRELLRKPPVLRFLVLAVAVFVVDEDDDDVAVAAADIADEDELMAELSNLLVVLVLLLCNVELLLVLVVLLADTLASSSD